MMLFYVLLLIYVHFVSAKHPFPSKIEEQKLRHLSKDYQSDNSVSYRLPNNTKPEAYEISLWTNVHTGNITFGGKVTIKLRAETDTSNITIHYRDLNILDTKVSTFGSSPNEIPIVNRTYDAKTEFYRVYLKNPLKKGQKYLLIIKYQGMLRKHNPTGVFQQSYVDDAGKTRYLLATHFEPHNARHGFPCYDEPALKAIITIQITHDQYYTAVSNMPVSKATLNKTDGTVTTTFEPTPLMSTYLTAFAVTDYANISRIAEYPKLNRVLAQSNKINQSQIVLATGVKLLEGIRKYLDVPFSLPKMDQIVVPVFDGAMENWGLIVYASSNFFFNETTDLYLDKQSIYRIVSHECSHQWFGNLVGPRWWTYLWLNEGFATYFSYKALELIYSDMQAMDFHVLNNVHSSLSTDSIHTRPMTYYTEDPNTISGLFDKVVYSKSASVIGMFSHVFGERSFRKGLKYYLEQKGYSDAAEEDLFDALEKAVKEDNTLNPRYNVKTIMSTWTRQAGFPILHVTVRDDGTIEVVQERYFNAISQSDNTSLWWIPYNYVTASDTGNILTSTLPDGWIKQKTTTIEPKSIRKRQPNDWVVFNKQQTGFYRVKYDERNYKRIGDGLAKDPFKLHHLTKGQLLHDVNNFMDTGRIEGYDIFLGLIRFLKYETEYVPWSVAVGQLKFLAKKLSGTKYYHLYEKILRKLVAKFYNSVGADDISGEPIINKHSREIAVYLACSVGLESCLSDANAKINDFVSTGQTFHQNIQDQLYCAGLRNATEEQYNAVWKMLFMDNYKKQRETLLNALSCTRSEVLLKKFLGSVVKNANTYEYSRLDKRYILESVFRSGEKGLKLVIEFLTEYYDDVVKEFGSNYIQNSVLDDIASYVTNDELDADYQKLLDRTGYPDTKYYYQEFVKENREWNSKYLDGINKWILQNA